MADKSPDDVRNMWAIPGCDRHAENFSLKDFFPITGSSLYERVKPFSKQGAWVMELAFVSFEIDTIWG